MPSKKRKSNVQKYQDKACNYLCNIFGQENVKKEWDVAKDSQDALTRKLYCPRLDIAVGPFNTDGNVQNNIDRIKNIVTAKRDFIDNILQLSEPPLTDIDSFLQLKNKNPRCFLAIEIEKSGSRKHMLGDIANVSILGSIGIVVPFNDKKLNAFKRIKKYVDFAARVGKSSAVFRNVLIIKKEKFLRAISI